MARKGKYYMDEVTGRKKLVPGTALATLKKETRASTAVAKKDDVDITESMAMAIVDRMIETGSLRDACLSDPKWPSASFFMRWARNHNWADDIAAAKAEHAALMLRRSIEEADKEIPWSDWAGLEPPEKRLRVQMWLKQQEQRISARQFAAAQANKIPTPVVQVNNNNVVVNEGSLLADAHRFYEERQNEARIIDHDDGGDDAGD